LRFSVPIALLASMPRQIFASTWFPRALLAAQASALRPLLGHGGSSAAAPLPARLAQPREAARSSAMGSARP
jgi:hypothetical protein